MSFLVNFQVSVVVFGLLAVHAAGTEDGAAITVGPGGDLQAAIDRAQPGDTILLTPGATYSGNFLLPVKPGTRYITIRTASPASTQASGADLPAEGQRVMPAHAPRLAKLASPNRQPTLRTQAGAHHWRLQLLEFPATQDGFGDIILLGDGGPAQSAESQAPRDLVVDRCYIHGDSEKGQKRGIALNSGATVITGSYISDIKARGQDAQAIAGWNGPGPYTIENSYLEAAAENFILGGSDPPIHGLITADVVFRRNHLAKRPEWREQGWQVKNLFQLKNARRVLVEENLMEYVWKDAQVGYAILLTPRNQDGRAEWARIEDVTIRRNLIRHAGGGMTITGEDNNHPSGTTKRVNISDNVFYDLDAARWGGSGAFLLIGNGPADITIEHNTVLQSGNIIMAYGGTAKEPTEIVGFKFRDNLIRHNEYGVIGENRAIGRDTIDTFFPGAAFTSNGIGGGRSSVYPGGNQFVDEREFLDQFVAPAEGDVRLKASSRFRRAASDGRDLGADIAALQRALGLRFRSVQ